MVYLKKFYFPSQWAEEDYLHKFYVPPTIRRYYQNPYPFKIMRNIGLSKLEFEPITILYGENGSGKSTAINVIAKKLRANRKSLYNSTTHMEAYVEKCSFETDLRWCGEEYDVTLSHSNMFDISQITHVITSDDIFRDLQQEHMKRKQFLIKSKMLIKKDIEIKHGAAIWDKHLNFEEDDGEAERLSEGCRIRRNTVPQFLRDKLGREEAGMSNGENSFVYISNMMQESGLYFFDEPENSLSPQMQLKLAELLLFMARFNQCQIIMATHSPLLLSIPYARIYDLDGEPACIHKFEELQSSKLYYHFFKERKDLFESTPK